MLLRIFSLVILSFPLLLFAQVKLTEDSLKMAPPGTVWVEDNIYIDQFPVTNADYTEFLFTAADYYSNPKVHDTIQKLPARNVKWKKLLPYFYSLEPSDDYIKKIEQDYYRNLSWTKDSNEMFMYYDDDYYANFPAINISYEQAEAYCKWRTDMILLSYAINITKKKDREMFYTKFRYRLPKQSEWEAAFDIFDIGKEPFTKPVFGSDENFDYFHYAPGNVSEILFEKGKSIGLGWNEKIDINNLKKTQIFDTPKDWVGFRCVCEILEY